MPFLCCRCCYLVVNPKHAIWFRGLKYAKDIDGLLQALLWRMVRLHPTRTVQDHVNNLCMVSGLAIKRNFVLRIFHNWRWSWKKPAVQHLHKYSSENIRYYADWVTLIPHLPMRRLKFVDEAHFVSRKLHRSHMLAPTGVQPYLRDSTNLDDSFSLTLLTDISGCDDDDDDEGAHVSNETPRNPFYIDIRSSSNTEEDYLAFITAAVDAGHLCRETT